MGTLDYANLSQGVRAKIPCVLELSCFGRLLNLVARDSLAHYRDRPFMQLRKSFAQMFYSGGKPSAKKGKFMGRALEELLSTFDRETNSAIDFFSQWYLVVGDENLQDHLRESHLEKLCSALEKFRRVSSLPMDDLLLSLRAPGPLHDKNEILRTWGPKIINAIDARRVSTVPAPRLGGDTRWCTDHVESVLYIAGQLPSIAAYVKSEIDAGRPSDSVLILSKIITEEGIEALIKEAQFFLNELHPLHKALKQVSDVQNVSISLLPYQIMQRLECECQRESCPPKLGESFQKHLRRLHQKSFMSFWEGAMSFSPLHIFVNRERTSGCGVLTVDEANDLFHSGESLFRISAEEWSDYITCQNYEWHPEQYTTTWKWWETVGCDKFPAIYEAARHYLWVLPTVTACDSLLSIMGWKYDPRQSCLDSDTIATQMFIRVNLNKFFVGEYKDFDVEEGVLKLNTMRGETEPIFALFSIWQNF